jgi:hypothetical protein
MYCPPINLKSLPRQPEYEQMLWDNAGKTIERIKKTSQIGRAVDMSILNRRRIYG